jgi:hypothetical protein
MQSPGTEPVTPQWAATLPLNALFCWTVLPNIDSINRWASLSWNLTAAYIFRNKFYWVVLNELQIGVCMFPGLLGGCCSSACLIGLDTAVYTEFAPTFREACYFHLQDY